MCSWNQGGEPFQDIIDELAPRKRRVSAVAPIASVRGSRTQGRRDRAAELLEIVDLATEQLQMKMEVLSPDRRARRRVGGRPCVMGRQSRR